ncbi:AAA family ATPase [Streptomyces sp. HB132]|uniref:helix-turn-helix transcriptional regulator n=1 Tax=Streptomyces sp. HB132 TaxID=767388 RepID=UPI0027DAFC7D|nr:AAA family ATPase [Streptomyces sp. HB132]
MSWKWSQWGMMVPVALVEREHDLKLLSNLLTATFKGHGKIGLVSGAVASGKTELLRSFADQCADEGALLLNATATRADRTLPFAVLRQLLDCLPAHAGPVAEIIGSGVASEVPRTAAATLLELSERAPLVVVVDDVHHADEPSMDCLMRLVNRLRSSRILLVLAESSGDWSVHPAFRIELVRQTQFHRIRLAPLTVDGVSEMCSQHLGQDTEHRAAEAHRMTGGNRLLVRALIEDHAESGELPGRAGCSSLGESFRQAVLTCLRRSGPDELEAARGMAVLDATGSTHRIAEFLGHGQEALRRSLQSLQTLGIIHDGRFRHRLTRAAVYDDLAPQMLAELHTRAAQLLSDGGGSVTDVADHLVAAKQVGADWAIAVLQRAAEESLAADDEEPAIRYIEFALSVCEGERQRAQLRMMLVQIKWRSDPEGAVRHLTPLFQAQRDGHLDVEQTAYLLRVLMWHGRIQEARELITHLSRITPSANETPNAVLAGVHNLLRHAYPQFIPDRSGVENHLFDNATTPPGQQAQASAVLSSVLGQTAGGDERCIRVAEQILQSSQLSDTMLESVCSALQTLIYAEQPLLAGRWCDALLTEAGSRGVVTWQAALSGLRAEIALREGDLVQAERYALKALTMIGVAGWGVAVGATLGTLLEAVTARGDFESARKYLRETVPAAMFQTRYGLTYLRARGHYYLATDRLQAALADFSYCGELMRSWQLDSPTFVPWRTDAAQVLLRLGDHEQARDLTKEQMAQIGSRASRTYGASLRVLAGTASHRGRLSLLKESVEILQASGDRLTLTQALFDLSCAHEGMGEFGKAQMISRRAGRLAKEGGMQRMQDPALARPEEPMMLHSAQNDSWSRPVDETTSAADVLTLSERRVAALASLGYTNREISCKLHITVSTVEQHLTKVFRKLRVKRRTDLPVELEYHVANPAC